MTSLLNQCWYPWVCVWKLRCCRLTVWALQWENITNQISYHRRSIVTIQSIGSGRDLPLQLSLLIMMFNLLVVLAVSVGAVAGAPICSLPESTRLTALQTSSSSYQASQDSYANRAETAFTTFINNMYITSTTRLRQTWGSTTVSNYWNTAVAMQGLLEYADFHQVSSINAVVALIINAISRSTLNTC